MVSTLIKKKNTILMIITIKIKLVPHLLCNLEKLSTFSGVKGTPASKQFDRFMFCTMIHEDSLDVFHSGDQHNISKKYRYSDNTFHK